MIYVANNDGSCITINMINEVWIIDQCKKTSLINVAWFIEDEKYLLITTMSSESCSSICWWLLSILEMLASPCPYDVLSQNQQFTCMPFHFKYNFQSPFGFHSIFSVAFFFLGATYTCFSHAIVASHRNFVPYLPQKFQFSYTWSKKWDKFII